MLEAARRRAASCEAVIEKRNTTVDSQTDHTHSGESPQVVRFVERNRIFCLLNKDCRPTRIRQKNEIRQQEKSLFSFRRQLVFEFRRVFHSSWFASVDFDKTDPTISITMTRRFLSQRWLHDSSVF